MNRRYLAYAVVACVVSFGAGMLAQSATDIMSYQSGPGGARLDVLFDGPTMGADVDVAVLTFPPGTNSGSHAHGVTEIFYVLEGTLEHVVNGESHILTEGDAGLCQAARHGESHRRPERAAGEDAGHLGPGRGSGAPRLPLAEDSVARPVRAAEPTTDADHRNR